MSIQSPKPKPTTKSKTGHTGIGLNWVDGWNFGIGFGLAMGIALPIIFGIIGCAAFILFGAGASTLFGG